MRTGRRRGAFTNWITGRRVRRFGSPRSSDKKSRGVDHSPAPPRFRDLRPNILLASRARPKLLFGGQSGLSLTALWGFASTSHSPKLRDYRNMPGLCNGQSHEKTCKSAIHAAFVYKHTPNMASIDDRVRGANPPPMEAYGRRRSRGAWRFRAPSNADAWLGVGMPWSEPAPPPYRILPV